MKVKKGLIIIESALLFVLLIIFTLSFSDFEKGCENIYSNMLRLHVIANSDSETDQMLKLLVRDEILKTGKEIFDGSINKNNAENKLEAQTGLLEEAAEDTLRSHGCNKKVTVSFEKSYFNTRKYENITVPSGFYDALRVEIGDAKGKNWWCVMYPPLCLPAVCKSEENAVFSEDGKTVLGSDIKLDVRFKIVEIYQSTKNYAKKFIK